MWKPGSDKPAQKKPNKASEKAPSSKNDAAPPAASAARPTTKSALSQKTLAMKFMQRKKNGAEQKRAALEEQQREDSWERPEAMADDDVDSDRLVCVRDVPDPSLPPFFGRRSFGGFNKAVEDEYRDVTRSAKFAAAEERERREEVSAEEMASRMVKYTGLMRGRNGGGPPRGKKKPRHA